MKFFIKTYGCKLNKTESEKIKNILISQIEESSLEEADLVILNSCGVIEKTERKILKEEERLKKEGKDTIIIGCLPRISSKVKEVSLFSFLKDKYKVEFSKDKKEVNPFYKEGSSCVIIPISRGCLGNCSYCATKIAKGRLESFPKEEILKEIEKALCQGYREIQLTSQDLGVYLMDKENNFSLSNLIKEILQIKADFRLKLGMMGPKWANLMVKDKDFPLEDERLYNFFHIPVQSGDSDILKKMNREGTKEEFEEAVYLLRKRLGEVLISTDIIVGFPGEKEESFKKTLGMVERVRPHIINTTRFSIREGLSLEDSISPEIKKERSRKLNQLTKKIKREDNEKELGKEKKVLISSKREDYISRDEKGKAILLKEGKVGNFSKVKVEGIKDGYLTGKLISYL